MSTTSYPVNDALAVKLWSKTLDHEALKYTDIARIIGDGPNAIIHRKTETSKGPGDQVTFGIRMQLNGDGFTENELAEGNGESLTTYSDALLINELGHVVGVKSENTIDQQRVPFNLRQEARDGLADWYAKRFSVAFFNQMCGYTPQTNTKYTGLNAVLAPSTNRIIRQSGAANDESLTSNDGFTLDLIDKAKEKATTATPPLRPINIKSNARRDFNETLTDTYVMYLHPYQVTSMRTNTSTGQWQDLVKAAYDGLKMTSNPIFSGAIGMYNSTVLRSSFDITQGVHSSTGAAVANTRRAVFLGGQAAMMGFGMKGSINKYRWNEELFDHKRRLEVSAWTIHGLKKTRYNSEDYGVIVVSTYAAAAA